MTKEDQAASVEKPAIDSDLANSKREFIETFFRRGAEFAEELMHENERLRYRVVQLETERKLATAAEMDKPGSHTNVVSSMAARIETLEGEREALLRRYAGVAELTSDVEARYADIERENNNLANLYVASY